MQLSREILEGQLKTYQTKLRSLSSYAAELKAMTAKHSTPKVHYESDLIAAEHNILFYEGEIARIKRTMGSLGPVGRPGRGGIILPKIKRPGIATAIFSSIGFAAGAILGSRLKGKGKDQ
jgi:hypothetical protein